MLKDGQQSPKLAFTRHHLVSFSMCLEVVSLPGEPKLHLNLAQFHRASFATSCKALHHPALRTPGISLKTARQPGPAVCTSALQHLLDTVHGWDQQRMQTPSLVKVQCGCAVLGLQQIQTKPWSFCLCAHCAMGKCRCTHTEIYASVQHSCSKCLTISGRDLL